MRKSVDESIGEIGLRIKAARRTAGLTQEALAESIGATPQYLSDLERGKVGTSITTLIKICIYTDASADYLLFGESKMDAATESICYRLHHIEDLLENIEKEINQAGGETNVDNTTTEACSDYLAKYASSV